ncbi:MAG: hypothetical protein AB8B82_04925 [Roseovarius sp.]
MHLLKTAALILCTSLGAAFACPVPADMSKGVTVKTISPRGEGNTFTYRKSGPGRVDEIRKSYWLGTSNTVARVLQHGLLPTSQTILQAPKGSQILQDETYDYHGANIAGLTLSPNTSFALKTTMQAADGFSKTTTTTYQLSAAKSKKVARCRVKIINIKATQNWDGIKTVYTYVYFADFGFAVRTKAKYPSRTTSREILSIEPSKR